MEPKNNNLAIPVSIVIAGALIAAAVYFGGGPKLPGGEKVKPDIVTVKTIAPVAATDLTLGATNPKIVLIEYSDLECPFCKIFHNAITPILASSTDIQLVYRHFPIDSNHAKARAEAEYAACVGKTAGNTAFWNFINAVFANTESNDSLDLKTMPALATAAGAKVADVEKCVLDGTGKTIVENDEKTGQQAGVNGTPFVVAIDTKTGQSISLMESNPEALTGTMKTLGETLFANFESELAKLRAESAPPQE
jgi:protein-disulfide isomerase